jgi:DNA-binding CsgD family transcriptional regulator
MEDNYRVIGAFYEAAVNPSLWPFALESLARLTDSAGAHLIMIDTNLGTARSALLGSRDLAPDLLQRYLRDWATIDPLLPVTASQRPGTLMICSDYLNEHALAHSAFHQDFVIPNGSKYQASWLLHNDRGLAIALTLHARNAPFERTRLEPLSALAAHAGRAAQISVTFAAEIAQTNLLRRALDAGNGVCFMVDAAARVVDQSAAGEAVLAGGQWLQVDRQRRLRTRSERHTLRLLDLVKRCATGLGGSVLHLAPEGAKYPLLEVVPVGRLTENPFDAGYGCGALVFLRLPRSRRVCDAQSVRRALNCTSAEADVAAALAAGISPQTIARRRRVSVLTVRAQIRSLRALTGTSRVSELIALIHSLS